MIKGCKICGISDPNTLNFLNNHPHPPTFIGFICNYPKSSRYVEYENLKKLLSISPKQIYYVAVLVKPNINILEKIKNLPFDYYQLYDCTPEEINEIRENELKIKGKQSLILARYTIFLLILGHLETKVCMSMNVLLKQSQMTV